MIQIDKKKYELSDEIPMLMRDAYENAALDSPHPCSLCRAMKERGEMDGKRVHFHGSDFGSCIKKVALKMALGNTVHDPIVPYAALPQYLKDGHLHEKSILEGMQSNPSLNIFINENIMETKTVIPYYDPTHYTDVKAKIQAFVLSKDRAKPVEGRKYFLVTHVDGLGAYDDPDTGNTIHFGIECKAVKDAKDTPNSPWKDILEGRIPEDWYGQMQAYMFATDTQRWYLCVKNRTTSKMLSPIRIDYDWKYVATRLMRFNKTYAFVNIGQTHTLPNPKDMDKKMVECKFCSYGRRCWGE